MDLSDIIKDLIGTEGLFFLVGRRGASAELEPDPDEAPEDQSGGWTEIKGRGWHAHINLDLVQSVQFVEQEDHGTVPTLYYVSFLDGDGERVFQAYFSNPYLDDQQQPTEFQPEKLKPFKEIRDRYVDGENFTFTRRREP